MAGLFDELGLTGNEAKAYEALLNLGKGSAAQIATQSGVPYGRIYPVLAGLVSKGLARTLPERTRQYVPSDPTRLHDLIEERKKQLDATEQKILQFKAIYAQQSQDAVMVTHGKREFHRLMAEMPLAKKTSFAVKWNFDVSPQFIREVRDVRKRGVDYRTLGRIDNETKVNVEKWLREFPEIPVKHIDNEGVAVSMVDDEQMVISLIKSNAIIIIKDKPFIRLMQNLFIRYYETQSEPDVRSLK
jgi:sugar-specific transcriptional regulator TrmB